MSGFPAWLSSVFQNFDIINLVALGLVCLWFRGEFIKIHLLIDQGTKEHEQWQKRSEKHDEKFEQIQQNIADLQQQNAAQNAQLEILLRKVLKD